MELKSWFAPVVLGSASLVGLLFVGPIADVLGGTTQFVVIVLVAVALLWAMSLDADSYGGLVRLGALGLLGLVLGGLVPHQTTFAASTTANSTTGCVLVLEAFPNAPSILRPCHWHS